jgi:hypothetical protein
MPIETLQIRFTDEERALLRKRSKVLNMPEADVLRVCMICDAVLDGDRDAWRISTGKLREKVAMKVASALKLSFGDAPAKA